MMENLNFDTTIAVEIERIREKRRSKERDLLINEIPLTIFVNEREYVTLFCSPRKLDYLAVGFLHLAGLLPSKDDLEEIKVDEAKGLVFVRMKVPVGKKEMPSPNSPVILGKGWEALYLEAPSARVFKTLPGRKRRAEFSQPESSLQVKAEELFQLMAALLNASSLFKATGGVHSVALALPHEILFFSEDVGRHNAVDKVAGECMLSNIIFHDKILLSSGRVSSEIVVKADKLGLPLIASRAAPTSLSVELAQKMGITLVGFVRGSRLNIYTHAQRVVL